MSDKIANFEDYKNKAAKSKPEPEAKPIKEPEVEPVNEPEAKPKTEQEVPPRQESVSQDTMNIEIEDPYQFLNASEREEYILQRQKELMKEQELASGKEEPKREEQPRKEEDYPGEEDDYPEDDEDYPDEDDEDYPEDDEDYPEDDEDYDEEDDEDYPEDDEDYDGEDEDDKQSGVVTMELVVRIASIITGIVILFFVGMVLKTRVFDRFFAPDPDTAQTVAVAVPAGFTQTGDTVVVSGASSLNLRSVPDASSKDTIVLQVPEGAELTRIAVSDAGDWALVEVDGQQLYGSMKYLTVK